MHACPGPLCDPKQDVPADRLMCGRDWGALKRQAPAIARGVWAAWKDGAGAGTEGHRAACELAIRTARKLAAEGA
jgi:hypothetical protein